MNKVNRNIRAVAILDFILSGISVFPMLTYSLCQIGILKALRWCPANFNLGTNLWITFSGGILFLIAGVGLLKRKEWARKAHYVLPLLILWGTPLGLAYGIIIWVTITKENFKEAFN